MIAAARDKLLKGIAGEVKLLLKTPPGRFTVEARDDLLIARNYLRAATAKTKGTTV